jgi:hypothetical protein
MDREYKRGSPHMHVESSSTWEQTCRELRSQGNTKGLEQQNRVVRRARSSAFSVSWGYQARR